MATKSVAPAPAEPTAVAHIPFCDLVALRDEIDLLRLAIYGAPQSRDDRDHQVPPMEVLERAVNRVADHVYLFVAEADVTGGVPE